MQAVHNAPNEMRRHLDSGGAANGTSQDSKPRAEPLPAGTSKGYYFNVRHFTLPTAAELQRWLAGSLHLPR